MSGNFRPQHNTVSPLESSVTRPHARYGRKRVVVPVLLIYTCVTGLVASSTSYHQFLLLRGISGMLHGGLQNVTHVLQAELVPPK